MLLFYWSPGNGEPLRKTELETDDVRDGLERDSYQGDWVVGYCSR